MNKVRKNGWRTALLVPSVFMVFVSGVVIFGVYRLSFRVSEPPVADDAETVEPVVTAPTVEEYRTDFIVAMAPLLAAFRDFNEVPSEVAVSVRDRLMTMTVPGSERDSLLEMVLILDRLIAADTSEAVGGKDISESIDEYLRKYPWIAEGR